MKIYTNLFTLLLFFLSTTISYSQNVGITDNGATFSPDASSVLELKSTSRGVLVPRMTSAERTAISGPGVGLMVYDTDTKSFWYYDVTWKNISGNVIDKDGDTKIQVEKNADEDKIRFDTFGTERAVIDNTGVTQIGTPGTNYTKIEADGSLTYQGNATVFEDLTIPVTSSKNGGSKDPGFALVKNNGASSQGVFTYWFDPAIEEELYFTVQLPHGWKAGSTIYPHLHWTAASNVGANKVVWGMEYVWTNIGSNFGNTTIITGDTPIAAIGTIDAFEHALTPLPSIDGSEYTLSSMMLCRIYRDATNVADNYGSDAGLLQIDFHLEVDADGSRTEYTK